METLRKRWLVGAFALVCAAASVRGQEIRGFTGNEYDPPSPDWRGQAGFTFLEIGGSARAEGMGGTFASVKGDPSTIFYNPAGMATIKGFALSTTRTAWIADMTMNHLALAYGFGHFTAGLSFLNMDYGNMVGTVVADNAQGYVRTGILNPSAYALGAFYAMSLTDHFNFGIQVKYVKQDLGQNYVWSYSNGWLPITDPVPGFPAGIGQPRTKSNNVHTYTVDVGTQYVTGLRNITVNMSLLNFGAQKVYYEQQFDTPVAYRIGVGAEAIELVTGMPNPTNKVMIYADGVDQRDVTLDAAVGVEYIADISNYVPGVQVSLRGGRRAAKNQGGQFAFGGGIRFELNKLDVRLDYAYDDYGPLLNSSRLGLVLTVK